MSRGASAAFAPDRAIGSSPSEHAIARAVDVAALFDYPLTLAQLRQTLVESEQTATDVRRTYESSSALRAAVEYREGLFFPQGRHDLIGERRQREARSRTFLASHRRLLRVICALPYVDMVALSGSIAHMNLDSDGDLDLFIITRGHHVWSVTVAVVVLAKLMRRRKTLCANFVIDRQTLAVGPPDLFTASQIIHLKPIVGNATYRRFLGANPFVLSFYRNFHAAAAHPLTIRQHRALRTAKATSEWLLAWPAHVIERICRTAYRRYLTSQAASWSSPEHVRLEDDCLKLHTRSHRGAVEEQLGHTVL